MGRYSYAAGALLGLLLTALAAVVIAVRADEIPRVVSVWPLLAALGTSLATWWLQAVIYAMLALPLLKSLRVRDHVPCRDGRPVRGAHIAHQGGGAPL